jgi:hypothetical protein
MKLFTPLLLYVLFTGSLIANEDLGEWWTSASFTTPQGTVITVIRKDGGTDEVSFVFRSKRFIIPESEIKALPRLRYDSASIAYPPHPEDEQYVALHLAIVFDPKNPEGESYVAFLFSPEGKFKDRYSYFRTTRVPTEK